MMMAVLAVVVAGTGAFFSDTETSQGNVFTAGSIDLMINHTAQSYNGVNCSTCSVSIFSSTDTQIVDSSDSSLSLPMDAVAVVETASDWVDPVAEGMNGIWIWSQADRPDPSDDTWHRFEETFTWLGQAADIQLDFKLAADDDYEIFFNGVSVAAGTEAWDGLVEDTISISSSLINQGQNTLEFYVENSGGWYAGLLFDLTIVDADCEEGVAGFQSTCQLWETTDLTNEKFFQFADVKPQDHGTNLISMLVESNQSYVCLRVEKDEDASLLGNGGGDMGEYLTVLGWYADEDGEIDSLAFGPTKANDFTGMTFADSTTPDGPVLPGETQYLLLEWCYGDFEADNGGYVCNGNVPTINSTQSAQLVADLQFFAIQSRNNSDFTCDMADFGDEPEISDDD